MSGRVGPWRLGIVLQFLLPLANSLFVGFTRAALVDEENQLDDDEEDDEDEQNP